MANATNQKVTRYAYVDTTSEAGRPVHVEFRPSDVVAVRKWINSYGNPSHTFLLADGRTLFLVDDFGALNDIRSAPVTYVSRKKDLFNGWSIA